MSNNVCDGVVECTALVLAESCTEFEEKLTLFGILDEIRPDPEGDTSFVVYAKFEGCEHATDQEYRVRLLITDEHGDPLAESEEYSIWLEGAEEPVAIVAAFDLPEELDGGNRVLWTEALLEEETISQTAIRVRDRYNV